MAEGSVEELCNELRSLAAHCLAVERSLQGERAFSASQEQFGRVNVDGARTALVSPAMSHLFSEARHVCDAARHLRASCDRMLVAVGAAPRVSDDNLRRTVLVVDDHADSRELVTLILSQAGFDVVTAANGLEALLSAHLTQPSLIFMDVQMPILNGIEATRLLKAAAATREIPVVAHTAQPNSCHIPAGLLFSHVLPKPIVPDVLLALTQRFVPNRGGAG